MPEPVASEGQAASTDSGATSKDTGATATAPQASQGQSANPQQTTASGPDGGQTESFFDPKSIAGKPELESAYKQMQSQFTKKMQDVRSQTQKIEAYDNFTRDPEGTVRQIAQQYGYQIVKGGQQDANTDDGPQSWDDVYARAKQEVLKDLNPVLSEVRELKQKNVESYLDSKYSDWRQHEDSMLEMLKKHPTFASDPDSLYRLAVPAEVQEARAIKAAREKLQGASAPGPSGPSTTTKPSNPKPEGIKSFNDAVAYAKEKLRSQGIGPLGST